MKSTAPRRIIPSCQALPQFGRYHVVERLGRGGMAEVYRAFVIDDHGEAQDVVIKRMRTELRADESATARFSVEALIALKFEHPNLVRGLHHGLFTNGHILVLEYVDGIDVGRLLSARGCGVPWPIALTIGAKVARALAWAHALCDDAGTPLKLVHRDVSPSNVMLRRDGEVKLLDFGIAKLLGVHGPSSLCGQVRGKIGYMAPEQLDSRSIDARCDQFALGVVLYELMTGTYLFDHDLVENLVAKRKQPVQPVSRLASDIPIELDALMMTLLAPEPARRFPSCGAAALAMEQTLRSHPVSNAALADLVEQCEATERENDFDRAPDTVRCVRPA
jgi:eukaryotic-like serine/threonine-protein kinase